MKKSSFIKSMLILMAAVIPVLLSFPSHAAPVYLDGSVFTEQVGGPMIDVSGASDATPESVHILLNEDWRSVDGAATTIGGSAPSVRTKIAMTADGSFRSWTGGAYAYMRYYWAVEQVGGDPYTGTVPLIIHAAGFAQFISASAGAGIGNLYSDVTFSIGGTVHGLANNDLHASPVDASGHFVIAKSEFDKTFTVDARTDYPNSTTLIASGCGDVWVRNGSFAFEAYADPSIIIDPGIRSPR